MLGDGVGDTVDGGDGGHRVGREWRRVTEVRRVADLEVDAGGDLLGHACVNVLRRPSPSTNARDDEADGEHDAEGGEGEADLVRPEVLDGESEHGRISLSATWSGGRGAQSAQPTHVVEHGVRGRVGELVGDATVGEEHDAVRVAGRHRVVGHHHDGLAELAHGVAHEGEDLGAACVLSRLPVGSSAKMISGRLGQRPGHGDALLLAAGELARPVPQAVRQADGRRPRGRPSPGRACGRRGSSAA